MRWIALTNPSVSRTFGCGHGDTKDVRWLMDYTHFHRHRRQRRGTDPEADIVLPPVNRNVLDWELGPHGLEPHVAKAPVVQKMPKK